MERSADSHYTLAVWMLFAHLACGLRFRLLDRSIGHAKANQTAWTMIGLGFVVAFAIVFSMLGIHIAIAKFSEEVVMLLAQI